MELVQLRVADLEIPAVRVTSYFSESDMAEFTLSTQTVGIKEPIRVMREGVHLWIMDGKNRTEKARERGDEFIWGLVQDGTLLEATLDNLATSGNKGRPKDSEIRQVVRYLEEDHGLDSVEIRKRTGYSQGYIEDLQWVNRAIPQVQQALDDELLSRGHAVVLARIDDPDVQFRILCACIDNRMTIPRLKEHVELVKQIQSGELTLPPPPPPSGPPMAVCHFCRGDFEMADMQSFGACPSCYQVAWDALRKTVTTAAG